MIELEILKVVQDIKDGNVEVGVENKAAFDLALDSFRDINDVVDATDVYKRLDVYDKEFDPYQKYDCIAPPWWDALICFKNNHGNVIVIQSNVLLNHDNEKIHAMKKYWKSPNIINWDDVKWIMFNYVWVGGRGANGPFKQPIGPVHLLQYAIAENGEPQDFHWTQLRPNIPVHIWDLTNFVLLQTLSFMNCRNIELVEPQRRKHIQKRIHQQGLHIRTINVKSVGKSSKSGGTSLGDGVPLHKVRGHFATYGINGRGLLFGKLSGRYWIPQHARGAKEFGEIEKRYKIKDVD